MRTLCPVIWPWICCGSSQRTGCTLKRGEKCQSADEDPKKPKRKIRKLIAEGHFMVAKKYEAYHVENAGMRLEDYNPKDARDSAQVGLAYMGVLLKRYNYDRRKSAAAYNSGPRATDRWVRGWALPIDTIGYLRDVFQ